MPKFGTEAEEAEWWYEQRHNIAAEFERVQPKLGPSRAMRFLADKRGITVEELQARIRAQRTGSAEPEVLAKLPRSA